MGEKNLDKLFQEKFKDFSEVAEEKVWQRISMTLDKKKSRKIIPFWWKVGGVAAVLAFLLFAINPFEGTRDEESPVITNVQKSESEKTPQDEQQSLKNIAPSEDELVDENRQTDLNGSDEMISQKNAKDNAIVSSDTSRKESSAIKSTDTKNDTGKIVKREEVLQPGQNDRPVTSGVDVFKNERDAPIASNKSVEEKGDNLQPDAIEKDTPMVSETNEEAIAQTDQKEEKKSIFDEINDDEIEETLENSNGKWAVGANVAPVYFNSFGEGSPIHSSFVANSKSGDISMSYGLSVSYQISKKLRIRSGISKVDYGYNTNDVEFSSSLISSTNGEITNIDYARTSENLVVESSKSNNSLVQKDAFAAITRNGEMAQQFGYLEIPMELNYALIDRRFGVDVIGGVSSLFLVDNAVALNSGELTTDVGKANNINNVNFSTNIGFGLNYKVTPRIQMNVEPVFKYQLNTFSNTSGNFQPFSIGVYSGLSYKF